MQKESLFTEYVETIKQFIEAFEQKADQTQRLRMVALMETHILKLNKITQEILLDDQPVRNLMQIKWIIQRVEKTENLLEQLIKTEKRDQWNEFLSCSIKDLTYFKTLHLSKNV